MDNQIVVNDYRQMDKILKEERQYLLNLCKRIKKTGCNVLLIQKSILRDAVTDLSLHFLAKLKIMVIKDIERDEIDFISKSTGAKPVADIEAFTEDKLGSAELVEEASQSGAKVVKVTGVKNPGRTVSVVLTGANSLVLEESERSLHDALCVVRCLVKKRYVYNQSDSGCTMPSSLTCITRQVFRKLKNLTSRALIAGGGAPEIHVSRLLTQHAQTLKGKEAYCFQAYAEALEVIPTTLAENAGLNPISIVTELRNKHAMGERNAGINVKKVGPFPLFLSLQSFSSRSRSLRPLLALVALVHCSSNDSWSSTRILTDKQGIISNILDEKVVQPLLVSTSALELATETVALILKIDDIQVSSPFHFSLA